MLFNMIISVLNFIISSFGTVIIAIVSFLPDSPFQLIMNNPVTHLLGAFNWIIPVGPILVTLSAWLVAVAGYYMYMIILRWTKAE